MSEYQLQSFTARVGHATEQMQIGLLKQPAGPQRYTVIHLKGHEGPRRGG